ncbi:hypothetical protein KEF29_13905 [Streptomyces tuirus]|uniref:Uncharacterized protein n=1 Tax=Streptomyces tuirus TaxID=68278 RepID=A0A941FGT2_9ACTN|nr:hypothetical protein [Streptomyces tuirus]
MDKSATGGPDGELEAAAEEIIYSAEVRHSQGKCTLTINYHLQGKVEVYVVPKKAVQKLPFYLSMLRSKLD